MNPSINIVLCGAFKVNLEHLITVSHCFGLRQKESTETYFLFYMNYFVHFFFGLNNRN